MGAVYLAHDPQLDRLVALKIPRLLEDDPLVWRVRFLSEARTAATLHHPNICPVFEVGEADSRPYLTMAYIEGETLAARLRRAGPPPIPEALALVRAVARAMAEAHDRGIVHRDLKPANIIIDRRGQPVVMDFGLALRATATDDLRLTLSGVAMGTPAYMPPEQAGGDHDAIGPPADVYALGIILYELVTGRVPFQGKTFGKLLAQIERDPPPVPSALNPAIDAALEAILLKTLGKAPEQRFATAGALADALDACAQGEREAIVARQAAARQSAELTGPYIPADESTPPVSRMKTAPRHPRRIAMAAGVIGVSLLALLAWVIHKQSDNRDGGVAKQVPDQPAGPKQDPPKPVAFPKQATLVQVPGWQILTDATKEEMQPWLDERKKNQHSVVWLDAVQVGDKPVFAAVAALDDRETGWIAFLDLTAAEITDPKLLVKRLNVDEYLLTSLSGFPQDGDIAAVALFRPGRRLLAIGGITTMQSVTPNLTRVARDGLVARLIRPFPVGGDLLRCGLYAETAPSKRALHGFELSEAELTAQLEEYRGDGYRPVSVVPYPNQGELRFAVTYREDATKSAWEVHRDLTAADVKGKAAELGAKGLTPASVTAYPWDGAVRYAVVWVKEPPREK
jgi:serine/threonine protein kinase